ncbi:HAD hydrolase family protein [Paeniglutamicibacter gangotriensis]|uniref:HAD hydrolase family protein n=1 Tax=Paeniglutamicibacter gangotriensis TaxID=254787 RepID=UPI0037C6B372
MNLDVRLLASDLDGTIIRTDGSISVRTIAAFRAAREAGIHIVFVTGRPVRWLEPLRAAFGHLGTVICSNGAVLYDLEAERLLKAQTIDLATLKSVRSLILDAEPSASFAAETTLGLHLGPGFAEPGPHAEPGRFPELDLDSAALGEDGVVKFLAKSRTRDSDAFMAAVAEKISALVSLTHSAFNVSLLEMGHVAVDKSVALAAYAAALGIGPESVAAFGDMPNDAQMLAWAGHGYAMASGHPSAHSAAAHLAPGIEEDGVAQIIEEILALRNPEILAP